MKTNEVDNIVGKVTDAFSAVKNPPKQGAKPRGRPAKYGPKNLKEHTVSSVKALIKKHIKEVGDKVSKSIKTTASKVKTAVKRNPSEEKELWALCRKSGSFDDIIISTHRTKEVADSKCEKANKEPGAKVYQVFKIAGPHSRYEAVEVIGKKMIRPRNGGLTKNPPATEVPKLGERESVIDTLARAIVAGSKAGLTVEKSVAKFQTKHNFKCGESLVKAACKVAMNLMINKQSTIHNNPPKEVSKRANVRGGSFSELTKKK